MPRKGRGGARQGTAGTAYSNRTDLNQPISTVPNQEYGMATAQREAQRAVPMGASPVAAAPAPAPAQTMSSAMRQKPMVAEPGSLPLFQPTNRPAEPVTAGLPFGPGAGPEAMGTPYTSPTPISDTLRNIAPGSVAIGPALQAAALLGL